MQSDSGQYGGYGAAAGSVVFPGPVVFPGAVDVLEVTGPVDVVGGAAVDASVRSVMPAVGVVTVVIGEDGSAVDAPAAEDAGSPPVPREEPAAAELAVEDPEPVGTVAEEVAGSTSPMIGDPPVLQAPLARTATTARTSAVLRRSTETTDRPPC